MTPREAADVLATARRERRTVRPFTDVHGPGLDGEWGYAVQDLVRQDVVAAGARVVGAKLGLTSAAKQQHMGVDRPIVGFLTDEMLMGADDVSRALGSWAQPRIEPEIAFITARDLDGVPSRRER